jgi:hypothetical protein
MARKVGFKRQAVPDGPARNRAQEEELTQAEVELERWKMLRFIVWMGVIGFVAMVGGAIVMYPMAVGFVIGIGYTAASVGFALGRFVFRQEKDEHEKQMAVMAKSVTHMEEMMNKGVRSTLEAAFKAADEERNLNAELSQQLEQEREARRQAQREHAEHIRDCRG